MQVGDLVCLTRSPHVICLIKSALSGKDYFDVVRTDGTVLFVHRRSLELLNESR